MRRYGAWVGILLAALYLVFFGGGWLGIYTFWIREITILLTAAVLLTWLVVARRDPEWQPRSRLWPAIVGILAAFAISTALSRHPRQSVEYLAYAVLLAALYLLLVRILASRFFRARIEVLAVALAVALGGAFAIAVVSRWVDWWAAVGRVTMPPLRPDSEGLTYGNPSAAMTIIVLFSACALPVLLSGGGSIARRLLTAAIGLLTAFAIVVSGSRAGWFAVGVAVVATAAIYLASGDRRQQVRGVIASLWGNLRTRAALVITGGAALAAVAVLAPIFIRRLTESGAELRFGYVMSALRMFGESPLVGVGPGSWVIERAEHTVPPEVDLYVPHAHNIYAQTAAEFGVLGLLAGVVLVVLLVRLVRDGIRDADPKRQRWGWAAAFALTYFAAHQLLDVYANMTAILFAAAIPMAWLDATSAQPVAATESPQPTPLRRVAVVGGAVLLAVSIIGLAVTEYPAGIAERAVEHANDGEWVAADEAARAALALDPGWEPYHFTMALTAAQVGDHLRSATAFRRVAEATDLPEAWIDLAAEEMLLGQEAAAREAIQRAARLGLQRPGPAMAIGDVALRLGETDLADEAFVAAIQMVPSLAGDPWWGADPSRSAQLAGILDEAIAATAPASRWQVALMAGDADRARSLLPGSELPGGPHDVIDAWLGDDNALDRIIERCNANPLDVEAVTWAARLEGRRGNVEAANRYRRWGYAASSIAGVAGSEMRVADEHLLGRSVRGEVADLWGTYTFRRWTPWNPWVPSVVQLTLE